MVWLYEDVQLTEKQFGIGPREGTGSLLKLNFSQGSGLYHGMVMVFALDGALLFAEEVEETIHLGEGAGIQLLFSMSSLVNLSDVRGSAVQHTWGESLLQDIPKGLNSQQNFDSGEHGVQLLVTPEFVGQQSLAIP
ncbi:hypothetical protein [Pseudodesulfovibrio sediminis]|nr:hypothetical protein [Pseudodesulfovibrio sediminis]